MPEDRLPGHDLADEIHAAFAVRPPPPPAAETLRAEAEREGAPLRAALQRLEPDAAPARVAAAIEGRLWMLGAATFRYHLPSLLLAIVADPLGQSPLAAELVDALTPPARADIEDMFDHIDRAPAEARLDPQLSGHLRQRVLGRFDSGAPAATFRERFEGLTQAEGAAILAFLRSLRARSELDYLGPAIDRAVARQWVNFTGPEGR